MNSLAGPEGSGRTSPTGCSSLAARVARLTLHEQLLSLLLLLALLFYYTLDFSELSIEYLEQTSQRALAMFAIARGLNAAISVIQSVELGFTLGVSATLSPGEVLDPLNDLIERFSLVMLVASVALWIIRLCGGVLFDAGILWTVVLLFVASMMLTRSQLLWLNSLGRLMQWGTRVFLGLLAFSVVTPWIVEVVHATGSVETNYQASSNSLRQTQVQLEVMSREMDASARVNGDASDVGECSGWSDCLNAFGDRWSSISKDVGGAAAIGSRLQAFVEEARRTATEASRQVVIQIAIFILETLLIPLMALWFSWRLVGWHQGEKP